MLRGSLLKDSQRPSISLCPLLRSFPTGTCLRQKPQWQLRCQSHLTSQGRLAPNGPGSNSSSGSSNNSRPSSRLPGRGLSGGPLAMKREARQNSNRSNGNESIWNSILSESRQSGSRGRSSNNNNNSQSSNAFTSRRNPGNANSLPFQPIQAAPSLPFDSFQKGPSERKFDDNSNGNGGNAWSNLSKRNNSRPADADANANANEKDSQEESSPRAFGNWGASFQRIKRPPPEEPKPEQQQQQQQTHQNANAASDNTKQRGNLDTYWTDSMHRPAPRQDRSSKDKRRGESDRNASKMDRRAEKAEKAEKPAEKPSEEADAWKSDQVLNEGMITARLLAAEEAAVPIGIEKRRKGRKEKPEKIKPEKSKSKKVKAGRRQNTMYGDDNMGNEYDDDMDDDFDERAEERRLRKQEKKRQKEMELAAELAAQEQGPTPILLPEFISVGNLGMALRVKPHIFLEQLAELGFEDITIESIMTGETAALVAQEYGFEPTVDAGDSVDLKARPAPEHPETLPERPPIVTIMGHVDHGKTTMLDWLRKSSVAAQEHGGITQHIGAFSVRLSGGKQITFLDTPGHAAFLTMRQRGAHVTDIIILVVAADDSVKPQTLEALKHAREAKVPIIVAINKIDKDEARPDQVKSDLARHGVEIEDYGGDVQVVSVSGKTGQGMLDLEENILMLSEMLDVRAESDGMAEGWVLESSVKSVGRSASVLVKRGTLRKGDIVAAGTTWARIRTLRNEAGVEVEEAPPGTPVEILGWKELPDAGDEVLQAPNEARAKEAVDYRQEMEEREAAVAEFEEQERREREEAEKKALEEEEEREREREGERDRGGKEGKEKKEGNEKEEGDEEKEDESGPKKVTFVVKGDVMGSVEAVCAGMQEIGNHEVLPSILRSGPGAVTESDVEHAATTRSSIVSFNLAVPPSIKRMAEEAHVPLLEHTVIYHLIDDVKAKLAAVLPPTVTSHVVGEAEVLQVFPINTRGREYKNIAGCRVRNGQVQRNALYRVLRGGKTIFDGKLDSLKQGKKDVAEMRKGTECGLSFDQWQDMKVGDTIQAYENKYEKRRL